MDFWVSPPEVTSARIAHGPGAGSLRAAATAWDGLGEDLLATANEFSSVVSNLTEAAWQGPSATAMAELAFSYSCWLRDAATAAAQAARQASAAAAAFDATLAATVPLQTLVGNRSQLVSLVKSNILGFNAPAIAATEAAYEQMWAQDVAAMADYYASASAVIAQLTPWQTLLTRSPGAAPATSVTAAAAPAASAAASDVTLVIGGSGFPLPSQSYVNNALANYVTPNFPAFTVANAQALLTPAQSYWITGIKTLTEDASWAQGLTILDNAIHSQLTSGNHVVVQGFSQGAGIASLEMAKLKAAGVPSDAVSFSLVGNPMNPNGGLYSRFDGLTLPSMGKSFPGSTPANDYPTVVYTIEYDGFADFPRYPLNIVADANAMLGALYVHPLYPTLTPAQLATAVELPTEGPTMTTYYVIPTQNLPLLEPLRTSFLGNTIADLIQPDLKVIVNLGYGDPDYGYSTSPANVPTPFGLFPDVSPARVVNALVSGTQQGTNDASADLRLWHPPSLPGMPATGFPQVSLPGFAPPTVDSVIHGLQTANTDITTAATSAAASAYSTLLPTLDTLTAIAVSLPSYDVNLFLDGIGQAVEGDPAGIINAIGYPIAADTGLLTFLSFFLAYAYYSAAKSIVADFTGLL
ncbi:PPE family protein [Mycobacterium camsae]|uniref:PPE family protein n=1 Tax=Mycobacterium gordonae TaxID=1778 RepID=UPI00197F6868|nr:PPE family protein [Mycobacterium gordonae]